MKKMISIMAAVLALVFCLTACSQALTNASEGQSLAKGGVLCLSVNPEIAVNYDENGLVTGVTARNDDALKILANYTGFQGKEARIVVSELVTAIGEAGYFVEEIEGERRQITLEIEPGSSLPSDTFLDDVISEVKIAVGNNKWSAPLKVENESDYGLTDYVDTDYGTASDGFTDYDDTDYGPISDGITDYDHSIGDETDYGEGNDGVTDYDGTDYDSNTDYGINADGDTDYNDTDYGPNNDGVTDYTDYAATVTPPAANPPAAGSSNYGDTNYDGENSDYIVPTTPPAPNPPASSGNSYYGNSNYADGNSNYDDGSDYGDSVYDD